VLCFLPAWLAAEISFAAALGVVVIPLTLSSGRSPDVLESLVSPLLYLSGGSTSGLLIGSLVSLGATLLAVRLFRRLVDGRTVASLGFAVRGYALHFVWGALAGALTIAAGFGILSAIGALVPTRGPSSIAPIDLAVSCALFLAVAVSEELVMRGYVLANLFESMNRHLAVVVTAVLFAVVHLLNANLSAVGIVNIGLSGVAFGAYYARYRNLWFPIGMHFTWNLVQGPFLGFNVSGTATGGLLSHARVGPDWLTGGRFGLEGSVIATGLTLALIVAIYLVPILRTGTSSGGSKQ